MPDLQQQANAQALYMQYLLEKAKEQEASEKKALRVFALNAQS